MSSWVFLNEWPKHYASRLREHQAWSGPEAFRSLYTVARLLAAAVVAGAALLGSRARAVRGKLLRVGLELVEAGFGAEVILDALVRVLEGRGFRHHHPADVVPGLLDGGR